MPSRHRERDLRTTTFGTQYYWLFSPPSYTSTQSKTDGLREICDDFVGNFTGVNTFIKDSIFTHYPLLNGELRQPDGTLVNKFTGFPIADKPFPFSPTSYWGSFSTAMLNQYAWEILAATNPSLPHVSVPTIIGEMKDIPSLLKGWGDDILKIAARADRSLTQLGKTAANANLSWRWAIKPLLSDLRKVCNFHRALNNRLTELYSLRAGRTLKRRCHLEKSAATTVNEPDHWFHAGTGVLIRGSLKRSFTKEVWGTAQWTIAPDSQLPTLGAGELDKLSRYLALGLTSHEALATAWELTPWSWLIDWFSNTGDIIAATNNSLGLQWSKLALMRHMFSWVDCKVNRSTSTAWVTLDSDYVLYYERKERWPVVPVIPFPLPSLPIIDGGKMSILASLAVLRR